MARARAVTTSPRGIDPVDATLPPPDTRHWVARRKALVVEAIQSGRLTLDDAWRLYRLSVEEFGAWKRALYRFGVQGLRVGRTGFGRPHRRSRRPGTNG